MNTFRHLLPGALLALLALGAGHTRAQHAGAGPPCAEHAPAASLPARPDTATVNRLLRALEALPKKTHAYRDAPWPSYDDGIWMDPRMEAGLRSPFGAPAIGMAATDTAGYGIRAVASGLPCRPLASAHGLVELLEEALRMARELAGEEERRNPMPYRP